MKQWECYLCGRSFVHARILTSHLIDLHNVGASR